MKYINKKYLMMSVLVSVLAACGSGGGGGSTSTATTASKIENESISSSTPDINLDTINTATTTTTTTNNNNNNINTNPIPDMNTNMENNTNKNDENIEENIEENTDLITIDNNKTVGHVATEGNTVINEKDGKIELKIGETSAMEAYGPGAKAINKGTIIGTASNSSEALYLMFGKDGAELENYGTISGKGSVITGMFGVSKDGEKVRVINNGDIKLEGDRATNLEYSSLVGIYGVKSRKDDSNQDEDLTLINNGTITIDNPDGYLLNPDKYVEIIGMEGSVLNSDSKNNRIENNGTITVRGKNAEGIHAYGNITAINKGTINATGEGAVGMYALQGATAINDIDGVINVNGLNSYGMIARLDNATIINRGKIVLGSDSALITGMYADGEGNSIINEGEIIFSGREDDVRAILASGGATYINTGKIISDGKIFLTTDEASKFIVGKQADGKFSRVRSKRSIAIDGDIKLSSDLIEGSKDEIVLENIFEAPEIKFDNENKKEAVSLFYDSSFKRNDMGNIDGVLSKNENTITEYSLEKYLSLAEAMDSYIDEDEYKNLSKDSKSIINAFLKQEKLTDVQKLLKDISGEIYANLPRQIFDIQEEFKTQDIKLIDSLNEYDFNFNFFGSRRNIDSKNDISGYKTTAEGIVGTKKFGNDVFGTIGYQNSNLKYKEDSKGSIQSIHTGVYKKLTLNGFNIRLGLDGEYNFHETNRKIESFGRTAKSKFNSYSVGTNGEISKQFGDSLYIKPMLGLNIGYGKYKTFTEENAQDLNLTIDGENYMSILPNVGIKIGKKFQELELYSNAIYSYELGNLNKKQKMSLFGNKAAYKLKNDSLEQENLILNVGIIGNVKAFSLSLEVGKEFGKRDNNYVTAGLGYKF